MTADDLFRWMARKRAPEPACFRCGRPQVAFFRDHLERPIGLCCTSEAVREAEGAVYVDSRAIRRRLHELTHDCPAEGCPTCMEQGA
jgi:hypothetical protein